MVFGPAAEGAYGRRHLHIPVVRLERQDRCSPATFRRDRRGSAGDGPPDGQGSLSGSEIRPMAGSSLHRGRAYHEKRKAPPVRAGLSLRNKKPSLIVTACTRR